MLNKNIPISATSWIILKYICSNNILHHLYRTELFFVDFIYDKEQSKNHSLYGKKIIHWFTVLLAFLPILIQVIIKMYYCTL